MRSPYEVLGVDQTAALEDIRRQYRRLALKLHPDRNQAPDAAEQFRELQQAYELLSDDQKRTAFDTQGFKAHEGMVDFAQGDTGNSFVVGTIEDVLAAAQGDVRVCLYGDDGLTSCGRSVASPFVFSSPDPEGVTCPKCLQAIDKQLRLG